MGGLSCGEIASASLMSGFFDWAERKYCESPSDYKTEEIIQKAVNEILKGSTKISIAHRIKTVMNADKILVLENGEIIEFDTPNNLLDNKKSFFYDFYSKSLL